MATSDIHDHGAHIAAASESRWAVVVGLIILFLTVMMTWMSLHWAAMPPVRTETIDPTTLHIAGEFVEGNLGTAIEPDGSVTLRVLANQYSFTPQCIVLPTDTPISIRGTAADVVHGFSIGHTNVNMMLVPGYISQFRTHFTEPGEHVMPCHEYCGTGHAAMWAHVQIVDRREFMRRAATSRRVSCVK